jgi:hypothetical protein
MAWKSTEKYARETIAGCEADRLLKALGDAAACLGKKSSEVIQHKRIPVRFCIVLCK